MHKEKVGGEGREEDEIDDRRRDERAEVEQSG